MKLHLLIFPTIILLFSSCEKSGNFRTIHPEDIVFAYDKAVYTKSEDVFIAVSYFKEPHEKVSLTLNGVHGTLIKEQKMDYLFLYKFSGVGTDEAEVRFLINGNAVKKSALRFASNMSLASLWPKLTKDYVKDQHNILYFISGEISTMHKVPASILTMDSNGNMVSIVGPDKSLLSMGTYGEGTGENCCYLKPFIAGIEGRYIFIFNKDGSLYQIRVTQKYKEYVYPERTFAGINQQLTKIYGPPVRVHSFYSQINVYKSGNFEITITELMDGTIESVINKL